VADPAAAERQSSGNQSPPSRLGYSAGYRFGKVRSGRRKARSAVLQALPVMRGRLVNIGQKDLLVFGTVEDPVFHYELPKPGRVVEQKLQIGLDTHRLARQQRENWTTVGEEGPMPGAAEGLLFHRAPDPSGDPGTLVHAEFSIQLNQFSRGGCGICFFNRAA